MAYQIGTRGIIYIRRGLRVVSSKIQGNATASKSGTGKGKFHAFLYAYNKVKINWRNTQKLYKT